MEHIIKYMLYCRCYESNNYELLIAKIEGKYFIDHAYAVGCYIKI